MLPWQSKREENSGSTSGGCGARTTKLEAVVVSSNLALLVSTLWEGIQARSILKKQLRLLAGYVIVEADLARKALPI